MPSYEDNPDRGDWFSVSDQYEFFQELDDELEKKNNNMKPISYITTAACAAALVSCQPLTPDCNPLDCSEFRIHGGPPFNFSPSLCPRVPGGNTPIGQPQPNPPVIPSCGPTIEL